MALVLPVPSFHRSVDSMEREVGQRITEEPPCHIVSEFNTCITVRLRLIVQLKRTVFINARSLQTLLSQRKTPTARWA